MTLIPKNKMGFLSNSIPIPTLTDPLYPTWKRCNTIIMSWLLNSLSPSIAQSVIYLERATDVWSDLRHHFSQGDLMCISELQEELYSMKQGARYSHRILHKPQKLKGRTRQLSIS